MFFFCTSLDGKAVKPKIYSEKSNNIDFGVGIINEEYEEIISVSNICKCPYVVSFKNIPEGFSFSTDSRLLKIDGTEKISIKFTPTEEREYNGEVEVYANHILINNITLKGVGDILNLNYPNGIFYFIIIYYRN